MLNGRAWGNSIWTDFKDRWNGNTYLGSYSTGSFMSDWSINGTSVTSQVISTSGSISGQAYAHAAAQSSGTQHILLWNTLPSVSNCDILIGGRVIVTPPTPTDGFGAIIRRNANGYVRALFTGSSTFPRNIVGLLSINSANVYNTNYSYTWSLNTWYWIRINASGGTIKVKTWPRSSSEPASWGVTWSPLIPQTSAGQSGVLLAGAANSSQQIDFFSFCSDGNPAWGPL